MIIVMIGLLVASYRVDIKYVKVAMNLSYIRNVMWLYQIKDVVNLVGDDREEMGLQVMDTAFASIGLMVWEKIYEKLYFNFSVSLWMGNVLIMFIGY